MISQVPLLLLEGNATSVSMVSTIKLFLLGPAAFPYLLHSSFETLNTIRLFLNSIAYCSARVSIPVAPPDTIVYLLKRGSSLKYLFSEDTSLKTSQLCIFSL